MKKTILFATLMILSTWIFAQTTWNADPVHSNVKFTVTHMVISQVDGTFKTFNGTLVQKNPDFTGSDIDFTVDVNSISTDNDMRDKHLKSDDFFNAEKYPQMTFKSVVFKKVSGNKYELLGKLTIRDVTKNVKFDVIYGGTVKDAMGKTRAGFRASTTINRLEYGLKWNAMTEAGGAVVSSDVDIHLNLEFVQAK